MERRVKNDNLICDIHGAVHGYDLSYRVRIELLSNCGFVMGGHNFRRCVFDSQHGRLVKNRQKYGGSRSYNDSFSCTILYQNFGTLYQFFGTLDTFL